MTSTPTPAADGAREACQRCKANADHARLANANHDAMARALKAKDDELKAIRAPVDARPSREEIAKNEERWDAVHDLVYEARELVRLQIPAETRPGGLFKALQDALYAIRGRDNLALSDNGAAPQRCGVQTNDALKSLADLFSESAHETWTRDEIINIIEDAIRLRSPALPSADYECQDCIGMKEHGCYCKSVGAVAPGGPLPSTLHQCSICAKRVASPCDSMTAAASCPISSHHEASK